jgi:hypothetical protein
MCSISLTTLKWWNCTRKCAPTFGTENNKHSSVQCWPWDEPRHVWTARFAQEYLRFISFVSFIILLSNFFVITVSVSHESLSQRSLNYITVYFISWWFCCFLWINWYWHPSACFITETNQWISMEFMHLHENQSGDYLILVGMMLK